MREVSTREDPEHGVFAAALDAAIGRRGWSLARLSRALEQCGTPVTPAALSYWRSGRSRPERAVSLAALTHLEDLLRLDHGGLTCLLPAPRVRGRSGGRGEEATAADRVGSSSAIPEVAVLERVLRGLGLSWRNGLLTRRVHDRLTVDRRGCPTTTLIRVAGSAERDGADRLVLLFNNTGQLAVQPAYPRAVRGCAVGRIREVPEHRLLVAEMLLPRPLDRGEHWACEYEIVHTSREEPDLRHERAFRRAADSYLLEVEFHPDRLPTAVERYTLEGDEPSDRVPVRLSGSTAQAIWHGLPAGRVGMRWRWRGPLP